MMSNRVFFGVVGGIVVLTFIELLALQHVAEVFFDIHVTLWDASVAIVLVSFLKVNLDFKGRE